PRTVHRHGHPRRHRRRSRGSGPVPRRRPDRRRSPAAERRADLRVHARRRGGGMTAVATPPASAGVRDVAPRRTARLAWLRERGMGASILVAALAAAFGVILVEVTAYIGATLQADPFLGDSETLAVVVAILSVLLTAVAMYVAAVVTANTFSTIIA